MNDMNDTMVKIEAFAANVKKLGDWTDARSFEVRARGGYALLDLRSPRIPRATSWSGYGPAAPPSSCSCPKTP